MPKLSATGARRRVPAMIVQTRLCQTTALRRARGTAVRGNTWARRPASARDPPQSAISRFAAPRAGCATASGARTHPTCPRRGNRHAGGSPARLAGQAITDRASRSVSTCTPALSRHAAAPDAPAGVQHAPCRGRAGTHQDPLKARLRHAITGMARPAVGRHAGLHPVPSPHASPRASTRRADAARAPRNPARTSGSGRRPCPAARRSPAHAGCRSPRTAAGRPRRRAGRAAPLRRRARGTPRRAARRA